MVTGNAINVALLESQNETSSEVQVHISKRWFERNTFETAKRLFCGLALHESPQRNSVLIYINLRKKTSAIVADETLRQKLPPEYWSELAKYFHEDLQATYYQNATALLIRTLAVTLKRLFPANAF